MWGTGRVCGETIGRKSSVGGLQVGKSTASRLQTLPRAPMASTQRCLAHLSRNVLNSPIRPAAGRTIAPALIPIQQVRCAVVAKGYKKKDGDTKKKKKARTSFLTPDLKDVEQFALLDAIR